MKPIHIVLIFLAYLIIIYLSPVLNPELIATFGEEDGVIENIGALFFLLASVFFFITYIKIGKSITSGYKKPEALWTLGLTFLFFIACGEEISWGQRIFNFATPEGLREINEQHEFNIHNIDLFGRNEHGEIKTGLMALVTSHRIFYAVLIGLFILIPLFGLFNNWLSRLIIRMEIPITPIWIGSMFLAVFVFVKIIQFLFVRGNNDLYHALVEVMETNIAFMVLFFSISFYKSKCLSMKSRNIV